MQGRPSILALAFATMIACGGGTATVPGGSSPNDGGDASQPSACADAGGICLPEGDPAPPTYERSPLPCEATKVCWVLVGSTPPPPCVTDQDCNENATMSALMGSCFEGMCMCNAPYHVQPNGKCGSALPPDCQSSGGSCRQEPAQCESGELEGNADANMSCGDFVPAVCCYAKVQCKTTVDFVCCGASTQPYEPNCVNGWRTCAGLGPTPMLRKATCGP